MKHLDFAQALRTSLLDAGSTGPKDIADQLLSADIARYLNELCSAQVLELLACLSLAQRAEVFGHLPLERQVELAHGLPRSELAALLGAMSADERADLFNRISSVDREALWPALAQAERDDLRRLCSYAEGTAGALMTSEYSSVGVDLSAAQAIDALRREAADAETIYQTYVLDDQRRLLGTLSLRELILAAPDAPVAQLMVKPVVSVTVAASQESVARLINHYDLLALPVLDDDARLVGIVTCDDAMDVVVEEATEDFHKGALIATRIGNLKTATIGLLYRKRVFWLVLLVFGNLFSGAGIAAFEDTIAANIVLVFFLPLLVDSGGNAGAQSATLMVRGLATGEVVMRDWLSMLWRECSVALLLGLSMSVAVASLGALRGGADVAFIVASSMLIIVLVGSLIGMSLPFLLSRMRLDPATASGPLVTSIADAAGVLVYFGIASLVLDI